MDTVSYMLGKRAGGGTTIETDPIFSSSPASGITSSDIENWNGKSDFSGDYDDLTNKPDLTDYVKDDDYATSSKGGVLKTTSAYNFYLNNNGVPYSPTSTYEAYLEKQSTTFIGKGTLENVIAGKGLQIQLSTMPTASADYLDKIVQFTGTTDSTYTNGYFYKCVSDGQEPATYSWEEVEVQAGGGGGSSYTAGTNISIDSNNAINCDVPYFMGSDTSTNFHGNCIGTGQTINGNRSNAIGNLVTVGTSATAIGHYSKAINNGAVAIGASSECSSNGAVSIGESSIANSNYAVAVGRWTKANHSGSIALGSYAQTTKPNQMMIGSGNAPISEIVMRISPNANDVKVVATEEFVTNYLTTLSTYDATKTQVLKNVNGTLTWVDE